ncbi:MAG: riboflavin synthase, partial [Candidatus Sulfotelmatobacter sp.]
MCTVAIIPHTVEMTNLKSLNPGDPINLEADLIAKYVEKMMGGEAVESSLTVEELVRQGF